MRLLRISLRNFRQHRSTDVQFLDGITGIVGRNGSGKTTLLEAVAWALYGQKSIQRMDRGKADTIRSRGSKAGETPEVTLDFELAGQRYTVVRRQHDAALLVDGRKIHTGTDTVTRAVTQLLRMDPQAFFTSFFTGQKDLAFLKDVNSRGREDYIGRLLGYERLKRARDLANDEKLALRREMDALQQGLGDPDEIKRRKERLRLEYQEARTRCDDARKAETAAVAAVADLQPQKDASEAREKAHAALQNDLRLLETQEGFVRESLVRAERSLSEMDVAAQELASLAGVEEQYEQLKQRNTELSELKVAEAGRKGLESQIRGDEAEAKRLQTRIEELRQRAGVHQQAALRVKELDEAVRKARAVMDEAQRVWLEARSAKEAVAASARSRMAELSAHLEAVRKAGPDGVCPMCERPLLDEFDRVTAQMADELEALEKRASAAGDEARGMSGEPENLVRCRAEAKRLDTETAEARQTEFSARAASQDLKREETLLQGVQRRLAGNRAALRELPAGFDPAELEAVRKRGQELRPKRDRAREIAASLKGRETTERERDAQTAQLRNLKETISQRRKEIGELQFSPEAHADLLRRWGEASGAAQAASRTLLAAEGQVKVSDTMLAAVKREEAAYRERSQALEERRVQMRHLEYLTVAFDDLRTHLNGQIRPLLAETASELMEQITDGRYTEVELDDDYSPRLLDEGEWKPVISGGEEDVLHLSLRLAISQMIAGRAGVDLGLLVLDEVFGSLDESRRENVISLLQNLKGRFQQILLITHIESIHDLMDRCVWVDYDQNSHSSVLRDMRDGAADVDSLVSAGPFAEEPALSRSGGPDV